MKNIIKLLLAFIFVLSNYASVFAQTDLENEGIKGEVKSISTTVYRTTQKEGKIKILGVSQSQKSYFNKSGYIDSTEYQINSISRGKGPKRKIIYTLEKNNTVLKKVTYKNGEEDISTEYTYEDGQVIQAQYYQGGKKNLGIEYYTYDKNGNKLVSNATDPDNISLQKTEFTYTKDNKIASCKKNKGGETTRYTKYEYPNEKEEKVIEIDIEKANETILSYTLNTYNDDKKITSSVEYTAEGAIEKKRLSKYNKQGDLILRQIFDAEGKEETYNYMRYEYFYDKKGNWIQKVEYLKNGNSLDAVDRKIEYQD